MYAGGWLSPTGSAMGGKAVAFSLQNSRFSSSSNEQGLRLIAWGRETTALCPWNAVW
jgi:hypothetical protein